MSRAQEMKRAERLHRGVRLAIQLAFFVVAPGFFAAAFNGTKHLFEQLGAGAPVEAAGFVTLLVAVVAFTVVCGRFFCGYACAFGTLGDVLYGLFEALRSRTGLSRPVFPERLVRMLSLLKFAVLAAICLLCFFGIWSAVSGLSPWVSFAGLTAGSVEGIAAGSFLALGLVAVLMVLRERAFCQFLCPLGAIFALLPVLGFSRFTRRAQDCIPSCGRCRKSCPVGIWPDEGLREGECISCGRCADVCPIGNVNLVAIERSGAEVPGAACGVGALEMAAAHGTPASQEGRRPSKPVRKTKEGWLLLRGTEVPLVVAKAVLLLALFWLLGATRYLPSFADVMAAWGVAL